METSKMQHLSTPKFNLLKNKGYSVSPIKKRLRLNIFSERRIVKCSSERKIFKLPTTSPNYCRSENKKRKSCQHNFRTPEVRRTLCFDNISPISDKNTLVLKKHDQNIISKKLFPQNDRDSNNIECNEKSQVKYLPSVDTPKRKALLIKGINPKEVWSVIGHGRFGTVIKAKYKDRSVAVKIIEKDKEIKSNTLLKEMNGINLSHPNIINILKVVDDININYGLVIMELWYTTNMQNLIDLRKSSILFQLKVRYIVNICQALQYCHDNGVLHLDIKPKNVLVSQQDTDQHQYCKICDFGSSFVIGSEQKCSSYIHHQGTIKYMAPELLCGSSITGKADIFSLGVTMWQLLHEETPYSGEDLDIIAYKFHKIIGQEILKLTQTEKNVSLIYINCVGITNQK
ncbi:proto-oncogene serine/threonine-protein kinase mos isoform X2 [Lycorma delicatula]|uniref:proto-oncogene serine/threonine-protein kinase mos isoform X2 n=1 Tax=Lycorma delicatula TaxID=130591 RepID=UPI003F510691